MSKSAIRHDVAGTLSRAQKRENAFFSDYGLAPCGPVVSGAFGRRNPHLWGQNLVKLSGGRAVAHVSETMSRRGLEALTEPAIRYFEDATGVQLPWNLFKSPWEQRQYTAHGRTAQYLRRYAGEDLVEKAARFAGWLRAIAKEPGRYPVLLRVIRKSQSPTGMGSPRTTINLWDLARAVPSPQRAERRLCAVRERADKILSAYAGQRPAWKDVVAGLVACPGSTGKAAVVAVARTVILPNGGGEPNTYRAARAALTELHGSAVHRTDDGVAARHEAVPVLTKMGIRVYRGFVLLRAGRQPKWFPAYTVVSATGRTYHVGDHYAPAETVAKALTAWREQDALEAEVGDVASFARGSKGYTPLIYLEDSLRAGNCLLGTEAWLREMGWSRRHFVPAPWLLPYVDHARVRAVLTKAMESAPH